MRIVGLSDLHVGHPQNRETLSKLAPGPEDWIIVAGDVGETEEHLRFVLRELTPKFARVVWVPGNHELWTTGEPPLRGLAKYQQLVEICRDFGALTPEDPYEPIPGASGADGRDLILVPLFLLYDYTFSPDGYTPEQAIRWAIESGILCADETRLDPYPYPSRSAWCAARLAEAESRLASLPQGRRTLLVNHWPLRQDLCRLFRIPRFTPWCGTRRTEDWHVKYRAEIVVSGHLHMRATDWRDGVRFEEISLGYPRQYDESRGAPGYLRQIWPAPEGPPPSGHGGPLWHR